MRKFSIFMMVIVFISACASNTPLTSSVSEANQIATIVAGTLSAANTQMPPTEIPATPTNTPFPGIPVSYGKVSLVIPPTIASGISGNTSPLIDANGSPLEGAPEVIQIDLDNYILQGTQSQPKIFFYPADEYAAFQNVIADNIVKLNSIIDNPDQQLDDETLPRYPVNAAQLFASNRKVVHFQNGQGIRYVTQFAQYPAPINNYDVFYYFSGLTDNKQYYITVVLPINTNQLPENVQLADSQPAGGLYFPPGVTNTNESDWREYHNNIAHLLDNTQADAFTPNLDLLDALINSINIIGR
jgi:hypothetical protein